MPRVERKPETAASPVVTKLVAIFPSIFADFLIALWVAVAQARKNSGHHSTVTDFARFLGLSAQSRFQWKRFMSDGEHGAKGDGVDA